MANNRAEYKKKINILKVEREKFLKEERAKGNAGDSGLDQMIVTVVKSLAAEFDYVIME